MPPKKTCPKDRRPPCTGKYKYERLNPQGEPCCYIYDKKSVHIDTPISAEDVAAEMARAEKRKGKEAVSPPNSAKMMEMAEKKMGLNLDTPSPNKKNVKPSYKHFDLNTQTQTQELNINVESSSSANAAIPASVPFSELQTLEEVLRSIKHFEKPSDPVDPLNNRTTIINRKAFINDILEGRIPISNVVKSFPLDVALFANPLVPSSKNPTNFIKYMKPRYMALSKGAAGLPFEVEHTGAPRNFELFFKAIPMDKDYDLNDPKHPGNVELNILFTLSKLVYNFNTPHIALPVLAFQSNAPALIKKIEHPDDFHKTLNCVVTEWAEGGTLSGYIKQTIRNGTDTSDWWKTVLFQITSVLATVQHHFPTFRHNDCHLGNWLIQKVQGPTDRFYIYVFDNKIYKIPNIGVQILMWDYDFACIAPTIENYKVEEFSVGSIRGINYVQDHYFDFHLIMNSVCIGAGRGSKYMDYFNAKSRSIADFIREIVPADLFGNDTPLLTYGRLRDLRNSKYPAVTPRNSLLNSDLFRDLRIDLDEFKELVDQNKVIAVYHMDHPMGV